MTSASGRSDSADHPISDRHDGAWRLAPYPRAAASPTATCPMLAISAGDSDVRDPGSPMRDPGSGMRDSGFGDSGGRGLLLQHVLEHRDGLLHLVHRPERDAAVGLLERREVARDLDVLLQAGLA